MLSCFYLYIQMNYFHIRIISFSEDHIFMRTPTESLEYKWFHLFDGNKDKGQWFYFQVVTFF